MIYIKYLYLCFLGSVSVLLTSCLANDCSVSADPTARKPGQIVAVDEVLFEEAPKPVSFEYQLLTDKADENQLLLYLKDSVASMTISTYDPMGKSKLMIKEQAMDKGFYNFSLPKAAASNIQYWEVKLGNQRAVVFKR